MRLPLPLPACSSVANSTSKTLRISAKGFAIGAPLPDSPVPPHNPLPHAHTEGFTAYVGTLSLPWIGLLAKQKSAVGAPKAEAPKAEAKAAPDAEKK